MPKKKKVRVRLREKRSPEAIKSQTDPMMKARDKSFKGAPRSKSGRITPGYKYKQLLEGYRENGIEPTIIEANSISKKPAFVVQPSLGKRIAKLIRKGYPYTTVCRYCGITPKTFKDWLEKGRAGYNADYIDFYESIAKAEAFAEMRIVKKLQTHENSDWRVSAWQLERRWPEHWSKKDRVVAETHVNATINVDSKESLGKKVIEDGTARELARRLIDGSDDFSRSLPAPMLEDTESV